MEQADQGAELRRVLLVRVGADSSLQPALLWSDFTGTNRYVFGFLNVSHNDLVLPLPFQMSLVRCPFQFMKLIYCLLSTHTALIVQNKINLSSLNQEKGALIDK